MAYQSATSCTTGFLHTLCGKWGPLWTAMLNLGHLSLQRVFRILCFASVRLQECLLVWTKIIYSGQLAGINYILEFILTALRYWIICNFFCLHFSSIYSTLMRDSHVETEVFRCWHLWWAMLSLENTHPLMTDWLRALYLCIFKTFHRFELRSFSLCNIPLKTVFSSL